MTTRIDDWPTYGSALFSPDEKYRYTLTRTFLGPNNGLPVNPKSVMFIMLNPSTADAAEGDPTIRRCMTYARDWGYDKLIVCNLFGLRATDPRQLYREYDPIGADNDRHIEAMLILNRRAHKTPGYTLPSHEWPLVVCAWGDHGKLGGRGTVMIQNLRQMGIAPHYLALNASGQPSHPLYLKKDLQPLPLE